MLFERRLANRADRKQGLSAALISSSVTLANGYLELFSACFKIRFGVPPLGGPAPKPPEGGTPNSGVHAQAEVLRHALNLLLIGGVSRRYIPTTHASWPQPRILGLRGKMSFSSSNPRLYNRNGQRKSEAFSFESALNRRRCSGSFPPREPPNILRSFICR